MFSNSRRRVVAGLAAMGAVGLAPPTRAQSTMPCRVVYTAPDFTAGVGNYAATATGAEFVYIVDIAAIGDGIVLYSSETGAANTASVAGLKGQLARAADGTVSISSLQFVWPHTAIFRDGSYYSIVQLAYDQSIPVGVVLKSGDTDLGNIVFEKGVYDPNQSGLVLDAGAIAVIYPALMSGESFNVTLMAGSGSYSSFTVPAGAFKSFVETTLATAMNQAANEDQTSPCAYSDTDAYDDFTGEGCFLTTACCTVIGLPDDCFELVTLRRFRDTYLAKLPGGRDEIARYYAEAPAIAQRLLASAEGRRRLLSLYWRTIWPAVLAARCGLDALAYRLYRRMMLELCAGQ